MLLTTFYNNFSNNVSLNFIMGGTFFCNRIKFRNFARRLNNYALSKQKKWPGINSWFMPSSGNTLQAPINVICFSFIGKNISFYILAYVKDEKNCSTMKSSILHGKDGKNYFSSTHLNSEIQWNVD